jgi:hypothetical protein
MSGLSLESVTANGLFFQGGNSPLKYFQDCLSVSMQYRRAAGYFSSSVFIASDIAMSGFIERGGKIQIVCSPRLMPEDIESINSGIEAKEILSKYYDNLPRNMDDVFDRKTGQLYYKLNNVTTIPNKYDDFIKFIGSTKDQPDNNCKYDGVNCLKYN